MADTPRPEHVAFAADARSMRDALTAEGFNGDQAVTLLCTLMSSEAAAQSAARQASRSEREARVRDLLNRQRLPTENPKECPHEH